MSAKEMFEKLGYTLKKYDDELFYYELVKDAADEFCEVGIIFALKNKKVFSYNPVSIQELQAINKQIEELGWNK